jgi:hypothetical protein
MQFRQYDVVRVKALTLQANTLLDEFNRRQPVIGDVATIVEIYLSPPGYELECSGVDGITQWLVAFGPDDVELELNK